MIFSHYYNSWSTRPARLVWKGGPDEKPAPAPVSAEKAPDAQKAPAAPVKPAVAPKPAPKLDPVAVKKDAAAQAKIEDELPARLAAATGIPAVAPGESLASEISATLTPAHLATLKPEPAAPLTPEQIKLKEKAEAAKKELEKNLGVTTAQASAAAVPGAPAKPAEVKSTAAKVAEGGALGGLMAKLPEIFEKIAAAIEKIVNLIAAKLNALMGGGEVAATGTVPAKFSGQLSDAPVQKKTAYEEGKTSLVVSTEPNKPIRALEAGTVHVDAQSNTLTIETATGNKITYSNIPVGVVADGTTVNAGDMISTGSPNGEVTLKFLLKDGEKYTEVDPAPILGLTEAPAPAVVAAPPEAAAAVAAAPGEKPEIEKTSANQEGLYVVPISGTVHIDRANNTLTLDADYGMRIVYTNMQGIIVKDGEKVKMDQPLTDATPRNNIMTMQFFTDDGQGMKEISLTKLLESNRTELNKIKEELKKARLKTTTPEVQQPPQAAPAVAGAVAVKAEATPEAAPKDPQAEYVEKVNASLAPFNGKTFDVTAGTATFELPDVNKQSVRCTINGNTFTIGEHTYKLKLPHDAQLQNFSIEGTARDGKISLTAKAWGMEKTKEIPLNKMIGYLNRMRGGAPRYEIPIGSDTGTFERMSA